MQSPAKPHLIVPSLVLALAGTLAGLPLTAPAGAIEVSIAGDTVRVSGATPGRPVVLLGASREVANDDVVTTREYATIVGDSDPMGTATFQLRTSEPERGIFLGIDQASGDAAVLRRGATGPSDERWLGVPPTVGTTRIRDGRRSLLVLLVRPTKGAWFARVGDGASLDRDPVPDLAVEVDIADLADLGGSAEAPISLESADRLAILDASAMELVFLEITGARQ